MTATTTLPAQDWAHLTLVGGIPSTDERGHLMVHFRRTVGDIHMEIVFEYIPSGRLSPGSWDVRSNTAGCAVGRIGRYEAGVFAYCRPTEETIDDLFDRIDEANKKIAKIRADLTADVGGQLFGVD